MNVVSLGGVVTGLAIVILVGLKWWHTGKRRVSTLLPFIFSFAYGTALILAAGGLLGTLAGVALWGSNGLGDFALVWGVGSDSPDVTRSKHAVLSPGGHAVVLLTTVVLVGIWRFGHKTPNVYIFGGIVAGIALGLSSAVAGAAAVPLASGVNLVGSALTSML